MQGMAIQESTGKGINRWDMEPTHLPCGHNLLQGKVPAGRLQGGRLAHQLVGLGLAGREAGLQSLIKIYKSLKSKESRV